MSDILIRDVPEGTLVELDRRARESGMSRNEYLRHWLDREIRPQVSVTNGDLDRLSQLTGDLTDPDVMRQAWS
ncbi:type II toxin-antitoxin system VapB family antitoxin [Actinophytocola sediminis]